MTHARGLSSYRHDHLFTLLLLKENLYKMSYSSYDPQAAQQAHATRGATDATASDGDQYDQALASRCWDKCITRADSTISSRETECVANCAGRFIDTQKFVMGRLQSKARSTHNFPVGTQAHFFESGESAGPCFVAVRKTRTNHEVTAESIAAGNSSKN